MLEYRACYQILDLRLVLSCDTEEFFIRWHREYQHFALPGQESHQPNFAHQIHIVTQNVEDNTSTTPYNQAPQHTPTTNTPVLNHSELNHTLSAPPTNDTLVCRVQLLNSPKAIYLNEEILSLENHPAPSSYAFQILTQEILCCNPNFWWLHGNVVVYQKQAIIFAGHPKVGKTTMSKELVKRGSQWLADDFCPLHKTNGHIFPFPRTREPFPHHFATSSYPPRYLFCYEVQELPGICEWEIAWKQPQSSWVRDFEKFSMVDVTPVLKEWVWRLRFPNHTQLQQQIYHILFPYLSDMLYLLRMDAILPDFDCKPEITTISTFEAMFFLMENFKMSWQFLAKANIHIGQLWVELSSLFAETQCYKVKPGYLPDMVEQISKICGFSLP